MVFAAASLTAAFEELAGEFEAAQAGAEVQLHFAGTPQLVMQVREGAPADVFAAADEVQMAKLVESGAVSGAPRVFARNRLTIVTAEGNPHGISGLADLARPGLKVLLCAPEVPAGRSARQALERAGLTVHSVSDEPSVKAVVSKLALGEVDAGIAFVTDAIPAAGDVDAVPIPDEHNVIGLYPIAVLSAGENAAAGQAFAGFVLSPAGQSILHRHGFLPP